MSGKSPPYYSAANRLIQVDYRTIAEPAATTISNLQCPFAYVKGQRNFVSIEASWRPGGEHRYLLLILGARVVRPAHPRPDGARDLRSGHGQHGPVDERPQPDL